MKRSSVFLAGGALVLGFFLVGSVLAVRLAVHTAGSVVLLTADGKPVGSGSLTLARPGVPQEARTLEAGASVSLELGEVRGIEASGAWKVVLVPGAVGSGRLTAPPSANFALTVRSEGGVLHLRVADFPGSSSWSGGGQAVLEVAIPTLESINASGASAFVLEGLNVPRLGLQLSGASSVTGSGSVGELSLDTSGATSVDFGRVSARTISIQGSGAGNLSLRSGGGPVEGAVSGAVNLHVAGNPSSLRVDSSGMSNISRD